VGKKTTKVDQFRTPGTDRTMKATAIRIFGVGLRSLIEVDLREYAKPEEVQKKALENSQNDSQSSKSSNSTGKEDKILKPKDNFLWRLHGYISPSNDGRSQKSIQYFFVNQRPANLAKKLDRAINDTYKVYNSRQSPVVS
jgi:DNA mismatch repair ATPase MutL